MASMAQTDDSHLFEVKKQLDVFNNIYKSLDMAYVDTLDAKETIGTAIKSMLRSLDPYTEYYPEENVKDLKEIYTGKFAGIGALIRYNTKIKRVVIDEPYQGSARHHLRAKNPASHDRQENADENHEENGADTVGAFLWVVARQHWLHPLEAVH